MAARRCHRRCSRRPRCRRKASLWTIFGATTSGATAAGLTVADTAPASLGARRHPRPGRRRSGRTSSSRRGRLCRHAWWRRLSTLTATSLASSTTASCATRCSTTGLTCPQARRHVSSQRTRCDPTANWTCTSSTVSSTTSKSAAATGALSTQPTVGSPAYVRSMRRPPLRRRHRTSRPCLRAAAAAAAAFRHSPRPRRPAALHPTRRSHCPRLSRPPTSLWGHRCKS